MAIIMLDLFKANSTTEKCDSKQDTIYLYNT